ncbi:DUF1499 domain-containing protein [Leptothoe sp. PORK10 BA2]|uniref:DUF1499 domain-containing protein n=1 Tax=Leptothoe sp. PORK10 BA2 TaxID=3110254 RepID=UPI002B20E7DB|nr:DUF1499 domain-containing protein [Leptothoe sp. PORK10 BA2]MEA5466614.1 DUF1499 domain-containing protein [Leptothoe sp. PORK10 BA2]
MQLFRLFTALLISLFIVSGPWTSPAAMAAPIATLPGLQGVFTGTPSTDIGLHDTQLSGCPASPNCVSSNAASDDGEHYIAPLAYTAGQDAVKAQLVAILQNQPRTKIVEQTDDYIRVEFTSRLMGFVDDTEFYFLPDGHTIVMRSAARLGESDLGVNRRRLEQFRLALQSLGA